ncbi:MAG: hypothetical protein ICV53_10695 [Flavisolibacter sp.]|nr:hypothetical protein [Flavisolibacter sp.]
MPAANIGGSGTTPFKRQNDVVELSGGFSFCRYDDIVYKNCPALQTQDSNEETLRIAWGIKRYHTVVNPKHHQKRTATSRRM